MYRRMKYIASVIRPGKGNLTCNVRTFSVIAIFLALVVLATPALGSHALDCPGGDPDGNFAADILIVVSNSYKVGRRVNVELSGNAWDSDEHWNGSSYDSEPDTFTGGSAYKWVIQDLASTNPLNLTGKNVDFTTKNGLDTGTIAMKIKDDGIHYQDFSTNTQVASITVHIVDPDGARIVSQPGSILDNNPPTLIRTQAIITFQLRYSGKDLPWRGQITENIKQYPNVNFFWNVTSTSQTPTGSYSDVGTWPWNWVTNTGKYYDDHTTRWTGHNWPGSGKYHVSVCYQRFKNDEASGTIFSSFNDTEYLDSGQNFTHDEQPL